MPERSENLVLVDLFDRECGTAAKLSAHRGPHLHRAFSVFLLSPDKKQVLLQKRAFTKYHSGGLWANSCCSHPRAGEEVVPSAEARLKEELGMTCPLREIGHFVYEAAFPDGIAEYEYDHVLLGTYEGALTPDPEEIESVRWVTLGETAEELKNYPERFAVWFRTAFPMVLEALAEGKFQFP